MGIIATSITTAVMAFSGTANVFNFPGAAPSPGDTVIAIVSHHASIAPPPAQTGWEQIALVDNGLGIGPRVSAFKRTASLLDTGYSITASPSTGIDVRAEGVLVAVAAQSSAAIRKPALRLRVGSFSGQTGFGDFDDSAPMQSVITPPPTPGELMVVWMPYDNSVAFNCGPEGYTGIGGTQRPVYHLTSNGSLPTIQFDVVRKAPVGPGSAHSVLYAGVFVVIDLVNK